jgi:NhaA family Na+:H+ antiporter
VFLAALAIVDDVGAVLIIAIFFTGEIAWPPLAMAGGIMALLVALNIFGVRHLMPYLLLGLGLWLVVHASGLHATIAGVLMAFTIPARTRTRSTEPSPLLRLEHALHGISAFMVMPLFAFANAGVALGASSTPRVTLAVFVGLAIGKPLGVTLATAAAVRWRLAALPEGVSWLALHGAAWLSGIGFTMSLFIAMLTFDDAQRIDAAKIGILAASLTAGTVGAAVVRASLRVRPRRPSLVTSDNRP